MTAWKVLQFVVGTVLGLVVLGLAVSVIFDRPISRWLFRRRVKREDRRRKQ